jgi:predicted secreted hydrolase
VSPARRRWLAALTALAALPAPARADGVRRGRPLVFPRDHGAHPETRTEWWYATGWRGTQAAPTEGFQVTFFRSRTGLAEGLASRFAARQLLFAHAAVTQLAARTHRHDQRIARWSGAPDAGGGAAASDGGGVRIGNWSLRDDGAAWQVAVPARDFALQFALTRTQPLLLQGEAGWSRKGPDERQASHYYSEPQLAVAGGGRAWLDHEWSDELLHPEAVGWDWTGMNLFDGTALTAFRLRRRDGSALWAGGSVRRPGEPVRAFGPADVRFTPGRSWTSPGSGARYPVQWQIETPAGAFGLRALLDAQELDSRAGTGTVYWEGLSELLDAQGRRIGLGYLEMTGYAGTLKL